MRDVELFGGSKLTVLVIFLNIKLHRQGYLCTSLRHFENKFIRAPVGWPIDYGTNKRSVTKQLNY